MAILYENYQVAGALGDGVYGVNWRAMTFTPQTSHSITRIDLHIKKNGTPTGNVVISVQAMDNGDPDETDISGVTGSVVADDLSTSYEWVTFVLSGEVSVIASTKYAIVVRVPDEPSSGNQIQWRGTTSSGYSGGNHLVSTNSGSSWDDYATWDDMFREYGGAPMVPETSFYNKQLVAVANNEVWYESSAGTMEELAAANGDIDCSDPLIIFEAYGKVFVINKSNLKIADFINVKITTADLGAVSPIHGTVLKGEDTDAKMVVDYITNLDDDEACVIYGKRITIVEFGSEVVKDDVAVPTISFTGTAEAAGPHWYDYTTFGNAAGDDSTFGDLPEKATIGCLYRGRVVLSGNSDYPHQWYMMRQANPFDALYGANDAQSAVVGGNSDAGEIGDIVIALIPYKDDYLIFGCASSMWLLSGDPCEGGTLAEFDLNTGIFGAMSYCWDGEDNLYFWGTNGIYKSTVPGKPTCISEINLPKLVEDEAVNITTHRITMGFDRRRNGITVCITTLADGTNSNYFLDIRSGGFFPEIYPEECGVFSQFQYEAQNPDYRKLILGCNDGYLRYFNDAAPDDVLGDDTVEAIDAYVTFGPLAMSDNPKQTGKLTGLDCVLAGGGLSGGAQSDSDNVTYDVWVANSAAKVLEHLAADANPRITGTFVAPGRRKGSIVRKKIKGMFVGIKLQNNTETKTWAFERLLIDAKQSGRLK